MPIEQMYNENLDPTNMLDMIGWLAVQNGEDSDQLFEVIADGRGYVAGICSFLNIECIDKHIYIVHIHTSY